MATITEHEDRGTCPDTVPTLSNLASVPVAPKELNEPLDCLTAKLFLVGFTMLVILLAGEAISYVLR